MLKDVTNKILEIDGYLKPFEKDIDLRTKLYLEKRKELLGDFSSLSEIANGYKYFGFHKTGGGWVYREWAPAASRMYLTGDFNGWNIDSHQMNRLDNGIFEIHLEGKNSLKCGQKVQAIVVTENGDYLRRSA